MQKLQGKYKHFELLTPVKLPHFFHEWFMKIEIVIKYSQSENLLSLTIPLSFL